MIHFQKGSAFKTALLMKGNMLRRLLLLQLACVVAGSFQGAQPDNQFQISLTILLSNASSAIAISQCIPESNTEPGIDLELAQSNDIFWLGLL